MDRHPCRYVGEKEEGVLAGFVEGGGSQVLAGFVGGGGSQLLAG